MATATSSVTPEDLLKIDDRPMPELVDGELLEREPMGAWSDLINAQLLWLLGNVVNPNNLGALTCSEGGFQIFPDDPKKVRIPDISFIPRDRMPPGPPPAGHWKVVPALVVEVVSPNDVMAKVDRKVQDYLLAGISLIWVLVPETRVIHVYRSNGTAERLSPGDTLDGEDILPGFRCEVVKIFEGQG
jgi:Uma2 family endonuclease